MKKNCFYSEHVEFQSLQDTQLKISRQEKDMLSSINLHNYKEDSRL